MQDTCESVSRRRRPDRGKTGLGVARLALQALAHLSLLALAFPSPSGAQESYSLAELLEIGRERNPNLLSLRAERDALAAGRRDAGRFLNPELEFETGEGDLFESDETKSLRELSVSQTIENPLARHYRLGSFGNEVEAATEGVRYAALEVDYEVRLHFYRILYLQELVDLARLNEEALEEIRGLIETRARAGEVRELEAIRLRVEHMRAQNEVQAAELELAQFRNHLNMFLGDVLPEEYQLEGELSEDLGVPDYDVLVRDVLPMHPLLRQADQHREAAENQVTASRFGWIPNPVVSATSARELDGDIFKWGVGFEIPLWNQSRAALERDRQILRQMEQVEEATRLQLKAELMIHHNHLLLHQRTLQLFREGLLEEADTSMEIAETSYREGEISFVEYLDARRTYRSIQIEFHQALYDWNRELTELDRAVGGGIL
jgi:cobalt-zinc-cadmium efflux system outer membrane protein